MVLQFLFLFGRLNLFSCFSEKREQIKEKPRLVKIEAMKIFKYRKNDNSYENEANYINK